MKKYIRSSPLFLLILSGFFFLLDQALKYLARMNPETTVYLIDRWLGWEYLANPGIAFGLPVPQWFLLIISPFFFLVLLWFLFQHKKRQTPRFQFALLLILFGGISNYIDRILFEITIDYLRITTSIMNLADIMIVLGALLMFMEERRLRPCCKNKNQRTTNN